jgi:hypothetical protein
MLNKPSSRDRRKRRALGFDTANPFERELNEAVDRSVNAVRDKIEIIVRRLQARQSAKD